MAFIAGVGKTNVDLIFGGMPRLPNEGEEIYASDFCIQLGGGIPATLTNLSGLGVPVKLATELGSDLLSAFAKNEFAANGVIPLNLFQGDTFPVNVTAAAITDSDRTFLSYGQEANVSPQAQDSFYQMAKGAKVVLMQRGYLEVYRKLKEDGTILVFDTGWDDDMSMERYAPYLELADYYTPNQQEALKITGTATPVEAAQVLSRYFNKVVVKLDKSGCLGMENGDLFTVGQIDAFASVDSTGAGDAFLAGFAYGLFHDKPFRECILYGNLTGGKCVTGIGCLSETLKEAELLTLAKQYQSLLMPS